MEELFAPPVIENKSYPVVVTPMPDGFSLNAIDFDDISIKTDTIEQGIGCIQVAVSEIIKSTCIFDREQKFTNRSRYQPPESRGQFPAFEIFDFSSDVHRFQYVQRNPEAHQM